MEIVKQYQSIEDTGSGGGMRWGCAIVNGKGCLVYEKMQKFGSIN